MKLKELINENKIYSQVEKEIRDWIEASYTGLSIEFYPHLELVRTNPLIDFDKERVHKITEVVNIKIGEVLEAHAEEIYIAERLTRIWAKHPRFNIEVKNLEEVKRHPLFLRYLKELIIKPKKGKVVNISEHRKEAVKNGKHRW